MRVIGTAGHVDHGKSTLVKALTGIDPDRLKEEKVRQMTIDLGFAWYQDALGEEIGIVDVPGHRDFIENMLSGISAIDAVMLVIAADEGVMPQTREHLAVLDLLKIDNGMVVVTKIDLVQDPEWLDLVKDEIRNVLIGTSLEESEIVPVSAVTGEGMAALKTKISALLASIQPSLDSGNPRLPVDRVFSMQGFGTIVTGTLGGGSLSTGDQVETYPPGKIARIRGIQVHQKQVQKVLPGSRAALNITGFEPREVKRGSVVSQPGKFTPTARIDAHVEILKDAGSVLKNNEMVKIFVATAEIQARARVLGVAELLAADKGFVQFELAEEIIAAAQDRFILRRMSPSATIGGGVIINAHPKGRYRLNDRRVLEQLQRGLTFNSEDQLLNMVEELPFISRRRSLKSLGLNLRNST